MAEACLSGRPCWEYRVMDDYAKAELLAEAIRNEVKRRNDMPYEECVAIVQPNLDAFWKIFKDELSKRYNEIAAEETCNGK